MRLLKVFILFFALINMTYAAKITDPVLHVGKEAANDFTILHKDGGYIKKTGSQGDWFFSTDGVLEKKIGSGSGAGGAGGINLLLNNGFEDGLTNWTTSGGTLTQEDHVNSREGNLKFGRFVSTLAAQYVESDAVTISDDISAGCMADFKYSQGDNAFDYKVLKSPYVDPADVVSSGSVSDLTEFVKAPTITFPCDKGSQYKLRVTSTGAGTIDIDDLYLGSNKGFVDGESLNIMSANSDVSGNISNETRDFIQGNAVLSDTSLYTITFTPSYFTVKPNCQVTARNGVGNSNSVKIESLSASGMVVRGSFSSASVTFNKQATDFEISCEKVGVDRSQTQEAFTPEQANFLIDVNIGGSNISLGNTSGSKSNITSAGLDMVISKGAAKMTCNGSEVASGLTCSGSEAVGVHFNAPVAGRYKACATFVHNSSGTHSFRLVETPINANTITEQGNSLWLNQNPDVAGGRICSFFDFSSAGDRAVRLFYMGNTTGTVYADRESTLGFDQDINMTVELVNHNVSRPIIQNMVDTSEEKVSVDRCAIRIASTTPTIDTAFSTCSPWLSGVANIGVIGSARLDFSKAYNAKPVCTCVTSPSSMCSMDMDESSTTSVIVRSYTDAGASTGTAEIQVICTGVR